MSIEDHNDLEYYRIGTIIFDDEFIMEKQIQTGNTFNSKSIGECVIDIYPNEGPIPHFHIYNKDKSFNTCIRIYENMYFSHGGKYTDKFNSKQCKQLNEYLKQINPKISLRPTTIWESIVIEWENTSTYNYPYKVSSQPHYEDMTMFRDV